MIEPLLNTGGLMKRFPILLATAADVLTTAPLIAIFFFGWRRLGFPFVPFDVFDILRKSARQPSAESATKHP